MRGHRDSITSVSSIEEIDASGLARSRVWSEMCDYEEILEDKIKNIPNLIQAINNSNDHSLISHLRNELIDSYIAQIRLYDYDKFSGNSLESFIFKRYIKHKIYLQKILLVPSYRNKICTTTDCNNEKCDFAHFKHQLLLSNKRFLCSDSQCENNSCLFSHCDDEQLTTFNNSQNTQYKKEQCISMLKLNFCKFGKNCFFIH